MNVELGGNIRLEGFEVVEQAELLIAKKLVGCYVRRVAEQCGECKSARIILSKDSEEFIIQIVIDQDNGEKTTAQVQSVNLFMAIDSALKLALEKLGINL